MKIQLLGWESQGLRCPDFKIDLTIADGRIPRVTLLQMPNGTGKTTTLNCLKAAIDGSAADWPESEVMEYRDKNKAPDKGTFVVRLRVNDSERLTLQMNFDFVNGCVSYQTTYKKNQDNRFSPPREVAMFFRPRFARLFIFNGELAQELLDKKGAEDAGQVIDTFYHLYLLDEMRNLANSLLLDYTRNRRGANVAQVDALQREITSLSSKQAELKEKAERQRTTLQSARLRIAELDAEVGNRVRQHEAYREQERQAENLYNEASKQLESLQQKLSAELSDPCFIHPGFASGLEKFTNALERLKLPSPSSKEFFAELADEKQKDCICGRPLTKACRDTILRRSEEILADEASGFINALKADVRQRGTRTDETFADRVKALRSTQQELRDAETEKNRIRQELSGDEEIQRRQQELSDCKEQEQEAHNFLTNYQREASAQDTADSGCLKWFERELADRSNRLAALTGTIEFRDKTNILTNILEKARTDAHETLKKEVVELSNERLRKVLAYSPLSIRDITSKIELASESGLAQAGASPGQTLAIGYVFLTTLLGGAAHQFPLVIDSPAGPIDADVRREVAPLVPQLCHQFIAFIISTEREGFVDPLCEAADQDVKFLTGFRRTKLTEKLLAHLPEEGASISESGVLVEGRDYFSNFQVVSTNEQS